MCRILLSALCYIFLSVASAYEFVEGGSRGLGESCTDGGIEGTCMRITHCHVFTNRGQWWKLKVCGFIGTDSVICCPARSATTSSTTTTSTTTPRTATTISSWRSYYDSDIKIAPDGCSYLPPGRTTEPTGIKSWDKCIEYQMQLVYPCEETASHRKFRRFKCHHNSNCRIAGGVNAKRGEFPHMVLLGYGQTNGTAVWQCGGSLISNRFILTAAHCTRSRLLGYVTYAIVGAHRRTDDVESWQVHRIIRIIKHPDFNPRSQTYHNDIALLEVNPITLNEWTVPACLDVFGGTRNLVVATGWGATADLGEVANTLQKVTLTKFTHRECRAHYPVKSGGGTFNSSIQVCYGDHTKIADTCQGDSGGPLTILNRRLHCMYTVVGITSFGVKCGIRGQPGWYTKVSQYVPWIESIVWP